MAWHFCGWASAGRHPRLQLLVPAGADRRHGSSSAVQLSTAATFNITEARSRRWRSIPNALVDEPLQPLPFERLTRVDVAP